MDGATCIDMEEARKRVTAANHHASEGVNLESELSFPHAPMIVSPPVGNSEDDKEKKMAPNLAGDRLNIALLTFLYVLQGIPLGLAGSIPLLLQNRNISYKDQAIFTFVYWPFSIKLLWAPIVDSLYCSWFGRRKTWLVPTQYLIGFFMLFLSFHVDDLFGVKEPPKVLYITIIFFMLNFLAATQDIAVDGWALTMLAKRNVGYASTCNTVGQTAGYFLGNVVFIALESANFCNTYLRSVPSSTGIVTLAGFIFFWGIVFFVTTTVVMIFKKEKPDMTNDSNVDLGIFGTYKLLKDIIFLPVVLSYVFNSLTAKVGYSAADGITGLKLIEAGIPKEKLALLAVPMVPLQILLPIFISKYTAGPRPMDVYIKAFIPRLLFNFVFGIIVYITPYMKDTETGDFPMYYYGILLFCYASHQIALYSMFVSVMAFHAKISDPSVGGTYMTLLNTVTNLGSNWPTTFAMWYVDSLTTRSCVGGKLDTGTCTYPAEKELCVKDGGNCVTDVDGYYIELAICLVIGFLWFLWRKKSIQRLQAAPLNAWKYTT